LTDILQTAPMINLPIGEEILHHSISRLWRLGYNEQKLFSGRSFPRWI
jgi:hypothetical protein